MTPHLVYTPPFEWSGLRRHPDVGLEPVPNGVKPRGLTEPGKHGPPLESPRLEPWGCLPANRQRIVEPGGSRRPSMHRGDEGQPEPPLVSSRSVGCSAILRGRANWPRVPGLIPQVQLTVRFLREFLGRPFPISPRRNPCCGTATAAPGVTSTHEDALLPPPISTMRCRFGVTETLRCAVGKSSTMRCRFALTVLDHLPIEPGVFYVRDRRYVDFRRLHRFHDVYGEKCARDAFHNLQSTVTSHFACVSEIQ